MGYAHTDNNNLFINPAAAVVNINANDVYVDPEDNSVWLGVPMLNVLPDSTCELLIGYRITTNEFMQNTNIEWCEIMQVKYIHNENSQFVSYHAVIKTFWLREFQRRWKKYYASKHRNKYI